MKLSASYNLFDGEELLEKSISSIRDSVDFISVVYQTKSNFGNSCSSDLEDILYDLRDKGLVQELVKYRPKLNLKPHSNELIKRNIGLNLAKQKSCTHHMPIDCDEFYIKDQLDYAISVIVRENLDSAVCRLVTYYKEPTYRLSPDEDYWVTLPFKLNPEIQFKYPSNFPAYVDPTRQIDTNSFKFFNKDEIQMHHMSWVRKDMRKKIVNSSAFLEMKDGLQEIYKRFKEWSYPDKAYFCIPIREFDVIKVDNIFNIEI